MNHPKLKTDTELLQAVGLAFHGEGSWWDDFGILFCAMGLDGERCVGAEIEHFENDDPIGAKAGENWLLVFFANGNRGWYAVRDGMPQAMELHKEDHDV